MLEPSAAFWRHFAHPNNRCQLETAPRIIWIGSNMANIAFIFNSNLVNMNPSRWSIELIARFDFLKINLKKGDGVRRYWKEQVNAELNVRLVSIMQTNSNANKKSREQRKTDKMRERYKEEEEEEEKKYISNKSKSGRFSLMGPVDRDPSIGTRKCYRPVYISIENKPKFIFQRWMSRSFLL